MSNILTVAMISVPSVFTDGEALICNENITYGNTTISANTDFAGLISENATSVGSAASLGDGVFFIRGYFVKVLNKL